jgi:iron-sulfur cluster repair protein YtfE (RIC family)
MVFPGIAISGNTIVVRAVNVGVTGGKMAQTPEQKAALVAKLKGMSKDERLEFLACLKEIDGDINDPADVNQAILKMQEENKGLGDRLKKLEELAGNPPAPAPAKKTIFEHLFG